MVRHVLALSLAIGATLRGPSCGDVDTPRSGINAPCTRDRDCEPGLLCPAGACIPGDAGTSFDAAPEDAGAPEASVSDAADHG